MLQVPMNRSGHYPCRHLDSPPDHHLMHAVENDDDDDDDDDDERCYS
jgi:hypothetical protein